MNSSLVNIQKFILLTALCCICQIGRGQDVSSKAEQIFQSAKEKAMAGQYGEARKLYLEATKFGGEIKQKAYTKIGDLYIKTANQCLPPVEKRDPFSNLGSYMAAYDMYEKAGNESKMKVAYSTFPEKTDIICHSHEEGEQIKVYGWIGGTATLRFRKD